VGIQNVNIGFINCQSTRCKSNEISDVKDMNLDALGMTGNVSDQKIVGEVTPSGYSFHHAAQIHKKGGEVCILLLCSLKRGTYWCFQTKSFENYQLAFVSRGISIRVAIIYRLLPTKKNGPKAADFLKNISEFVDSLATNIGYLLFLGYINRYWDTDIKQPADNFRSPNLKQHWQEIIL